MSASVVMITGALAGIGRATALAFARRGDRVVVSGRRDDAGAALLADFRALGAEAEFVRADVRHVYVASKHAVEGLTKSAALEGAPFGVRVNAVAPGPIETEMLSRFVGSAERLAAMAQGVPMKRLGTPDEIAQVIVFLASAEAAFVSGQIVAANGGKTAF